MDQESNDQDSEDADKATEANSNEPTSKDDELAIAGVSTHDLAELEKNVIEDILGEGADASGFDLFRGPETSDNSRFTPSPSTSADKSGLCSRASDEEYVPGEGDTITEASSSGVEESTEESNDAPRVKRRRLAKPKKLLKLCVDDSNDKDFEERLSNTVSTEGNDESDFKELTDTIKIHRQVWDRLYKYQKKGVVWLCGLHEQYVGGILADEMGLGKTIQVIAFLRALDESQRQDNYMNFKGLGPCLIICPSTLLKQWVSEFHQWMPRCRVAVFHGSGNFKGPKRTLIRKMAVNRRGGSVLVTTYSTFQKYSELLLPVAWHYVVLDEGHKIRNPKAQISQSVKQLHTPCRIILSGTPLQNSLPEIWSLMDFVYSGKLNSLETFTERFALPITQGGYANATKQQLLTAYKCAVILRDAISPYILRRLKKDVKKSLDLPDKNEKVLFCELSSEQRKLYRDYLCSRECRNILKGRLDAFVGLTLLRKLCNHPDLVTGGPNRHGEYDVNEDPTMAFGYPDRSGKMRVLLQLLDIWKKQGGEKVLVFSQSREMLNILERRLLETGFTYLRMDGSTNIGSRQKRVQQFNQDPEIFIFLLTTRVGGLGINLTAANKVVIFDPDWNPSTDTQAKERSWRIGQDRTVTVYRLLCAGTIEEKVYHRQIFKQFLANRILKDPKQRQFFKTTDLHDLFSLSEVSKEAPTETGTLFASETDEIRRNNFFDENDRKKHRKKKKEGDESTDEDDEAAPVISEEKKAELRERAKRLAKILSMSAGGSKDAVDTGTVSEKPVKEEPTPQPQSGSPPIQDSTSDSRHRSVKVKKEKKHKRHHEEKSDGKGNDDFVLNCLLKSAGVRCAIKHDDLVEDKPSDYLIEKEASAAANNAAKAIGKRSNRSFVREFRALFPLSSTASSSSTTATEHAPFSGEDIKDSLFAAIHARKRRANEGKASAVLVKDKYVTMAEKIRDFLVSCGGRAYTEMIFEKFKDEYKEEMPELRAILRKLCNFDHLKREWYVKSEYA
ncbi:unnamed protein product [Cylicocyclus nassatus]|uniref:DNA repair and recombination protein RAD54-like n=1 Tax=Cylicocyclus nassatus TaxID=53992 RepID=A0AA36HFB3_CYLNA|nr:unnamed protein product [Cylicocyclus nassatus]